MSTINKISRFLFLMENQRIHESKRPIDGDFKREKRRHTYDTISIIRYHINHQKLDSYKPSLLYK